MSRHYLPDEEGKPSEYFWSDRDGDSEGHQKLYEDTPYGSRLIDGVHYDPEDDEFHRA